LIEFLDALGASILRSLVAIRAGLLIASAAFLEFAIAAANEAERLTTFLKSFFENSFGDFRGFERSAGDHLRL
jgi:hypothetical protein